MKILITGAAGFIGYHLSTKLAQEHHQVIGVDNLNDYYDVNLKKSRLNNLNKLDNFTFIKLDICDHDALAKIFESEQFDIVYHLAAQAGVRYSIENPWAYSDSNLTGTLSILESCRKQNVKHLVFTSTSSVYGNNDKTPFSESDKTDQPVSLYAATKKGCEAMAYSYAKLYQIPTTVLRLFTVYGPFGRPDMAYFKFTKSIMEGKTINVFNNGDLMRDFTYIDDIVDGISKAGEKPFEDTTNPPYRLYNLGNHQPVKLIDFINTLEEKIGKKAVTEMKPMQAGDVYITYADNQKARNEIGFDPKTTISTGLGRFVDWYKNIE